MGGSSVGDAHGVVGGWKLSLGLIDRSLRCTIGCVLDGRGMSMNSGRVCICRRWRRNR